MKIKAQSGNEPHNKIRGFSLIELLIVVVILGILAAAVGVNINSASRELKTYVYNTKLRFNLAKLEATKRNRNVYVDFDFLPVATNGDGTIDDRYTVWVDEDGDTVFNAGAGDAIIGDPVFFEETAKIYGNVPAFPPGGPGDDGPKNLLIDDGVTATNDRFRFRPNGMSERGAVYLYFPEGSGGSKVVVYGPWAIFVNNVGRIRVDEWTPATGWRVNEDD